MGVFQRYLFFRFFKLLVLALGCSIVIFLVIDFVENSRTWLVRSQSEAALYYLNYFPHILYLILPIALLIATVFSVGNMSRHLELAAMRASGMSLYAITIPVVLFAVLLSVGMFYFGDTLLPDSNHRRFKIMEPKTPENQSGNPSEKYKFVFIGPDNVTYFFQHYSGSRKKGRGVTILMARGDTLIRRYDAALMEWENHWVLKDGTRRDFPTDGGLKAEKFTRMNMLELKDTPRDLVDNRIFPDEMRMEELARRINILKRSGESTRRFETQWHFKISGCVVNFIMIIFGVALSVNTAKRGLTKRFGVSLLLAFCYFILLRFGLILGENGGVSPALGAWLGNIVFGFIALTLYWNMGRA